MLEKLSETVLIINFDHKLYSYFVYIFPQCCRGFESETDTEEFEKVGQSPVEPNAPSSTDAPPGLIQTSDKSGSETHTLPSSRQDEVGPHSHTLSPVPPTSSPPEFAATDFYIDESLPSSRDSNDTSVAVVVAAVCAPHRELLQLQNEVLEKETLIDLLQVTKKWHARTFHSHPHTMSCL